MLPLADLADIRASYRYHAAEMADSPCYHAWATGIADDPEVLAVLGTLPVGKQQANLVFAAARWHGLAPGPYADLRALLLGPAQQQVLDTVRRRRTQTNEVRRLTALTPALGLLEERRIALVELGASAGLCLHPDRYDYLWEGAGELRGPGGPELTARASGPLPTPAHHPHITARIGIDLNPLDPRTEADMAWLQTLVWPEQEERRRLLTTAVEVARREPPHLLRGDMLGRLEEALALAEASGGTPVVHHSAAAAYLDADARATLADRLGDLVAAGRCHWVSLEGAQVVPEVAPPEEPPAGAAFVLAVDGRPVGWAHGHGAALAWRE